MKAVYRHISSYHSFIMLLLINLVLVACEEWDKSGYVIYCPCMGRFGNQAEHFLGSLGFAKSINRTLILPPWRTYKNEPFDSFFNIEPLKTYHRNILAEDFMKNLAPVHWPDGKRIGWCYGSGNEACEMKKGEPFHAFWDELDVEFDSYQYFNAGFHNAEWWMRIYPADLYPVIALKGAPARFPVLQKYVGLHQYLEWSENINKAADSYINQNLPGKKFIGIHLRNGVDWKIACKDVENYESYMSSYQCYGYNNDKKIDFDVCLPSFDIILRQLTETVKKIKAEVIYISTDKSPRLMEIKNHFAHQKLNVDVLHHEPSLPQINLAILSRSHHFIGSCISSFSAFVSRHRKKTNLPSSYWGYTKPDISHTEL